MKSDRTLNITIGSISVVFFILLLTAFSLSTSKHLLDTRDDYFIVVYYTEIGMLETGAPVKYGGVTIGRVTSVTLEDDQSIRVEAEVFIEKGIPEDSKLAVSATAVSGDSFLNLIMGSSKVFIPHADTSVDAPTLTGINFLSIQNIGSAFSGVELQAGRLFKNIDLIMKSDSTIPTQIKNIQNQIPKLASKYIAFNDRKMLLMDKVTILQKEIKEIHAHAANTTGQCASIITEKINLEGLSAAGKAMTEISEIIDLATKSKEATTIKDNYTSINNWVKAIELKENSIVGVILSDKDYGAKKTVAKVSEAVEKVQDFSIFKLLGFYLKGKGLLGRFEKRTNSQYLSAGRYLYNWSLFCYERNLHNCNLLSGEKCCPPDLR